MHLHHQLQSALSPAYTLIKKISKKSGGKPLSSLRVIAYHDIPHTQRDSLVSQLNWIKTHWNIVTPTQFELMIKGDELIIGDNVLITFDDGFISNRFIADEILKPMGIKAIFFIISDFANIKSNKQAHLFVANNIIPNSDIDNIPQNFVNMQWHDLEVLLDYGHTIGSHTKSHFRLDSSALDADLKDQLIVSGDTLSNRLGVDIDHFAYTFGDIGSFSEAALKIAKKRYKFIYSGIRGDNAKKISSYSIKRDTAAYQLPNNQYQLFSNRLLGSFLEGFVDFKYKKQRLKIDSWTL